MIYLPTLSLRLHLRYYISTTVIINPITLLSITHVQKGACHLCSLKPLIDSIRSTPSLVGPQSSRIDTPLAIYEKDCQYRICPRGGQDHPPNSNQP